MLALRAQLEMVRQQILDADRRILAWHRQSDLSQRLDDIPGVGPLIATALVASVPDPHVFRSGRDMAAWIGLVPKQNSTGGKERLGSYLQGGEPVSEVMLLGRGRPVGHQTSAKQAGPHPSPLAGDGCMERRPVKVAAIALANKIARIAWAMMVHGTTYREPDEQAV